MLLPANDTAVGQIGRFSFAGAINTAVGYAVIFSGMALGFSPYASNLSGYLVGLCCAFILNKHFVFLGSSNRPGEIARFLAAFAIAYLSNRGLLHVCLQIGLGKCLAQILAGAVYLAVMYWLMRAWVFRK